MNEIKIVQSVYYPSRRETMVYMGFSHGQLIELNQSGVEMQKFEFFTDRCFCTLTIIYCRHFSKVYLVGVSDENQVKICSFSESDKDRALEWRLAEA
jgi:hypothetical protein